MTGFARKKRVFLKKSEVIDYIVRHPKADSIQIARHFGITRRTAQYHMRKERLLRMIVQEINLRVSHLPECYLKKMLVELVKDPDEADVWVVAVEGANHDWAAYCGWPMSSQIKPERLNSETFYYSQNNRSPGQVIEQGDKLGYETARVIFPTMDALCKTGYRE